MKSKLNLKIGTYNWTIKKVDADSEYLLINGQKCFGVTDFSNLIIYVPDSGISKQIIKTTIIHELAHAHMFSIGLRADSFDEEDVCYFVEANGESIIEKSFYVYRTLYEEG